MNGKKPLNNYRNQQKSLNNNPKDKWSLPLNLKTQPGC
jgi:hypothetical protein